MYAKGESERILGEAFKRNGKRKEVLITSKIFLSGHMKPNFKEKEEDKWVVRRETSGTFDFRN